MAPPSANPVPGRAAHVSPRPHGSQQVPTRPGMPPSAISNKQTSRKMVARDDQRNESAWQTPIFAPKTPPPEQPFRDSVNDDIFFRAYYDPSFQTVLDEWSDDLTKHHQRASISQDDGATGSTTFGTRDGKTPETCFDIMVMGQANVGKTTFIARALDVEISEVHPPAPREVEMDGKTYYFKIRERSLIDIDAKNPETLDRALKKWEANPERFDGVVALYDLTSKHSLDPLPIAIRTIQQTGKTCLLAPTKADSVISKRQLDPEGVEKKVHLVVGKIKSTRPTSHPEGPYRCLEMLFIEIAKAYKLPSSPASRPRSKSSSNKLQSAINSGPGRPSSKSSPALVKGLRSPTPVPAFKRNHTPLPEYVAVAVDAANQTPALDMQASPGSEPFSPLSPLAMQDGQSFGDSEQASSAEEPNPDSMKAIGSHVLELNTFEELVARLCFRDTPEKDVRFDFNFLTFFRFFASPLRLLNALISVYDTASSAESSVTTDLLPDRVLQFLSQWITTHPGDFADEDTYAQLEDFLERFDQASSYFPVAEQIRMASGKVDEDDDNLWSLPDAINTSACTSADREGSDATIRRSDSTADLDAKLIFQAHSTLTMDGVGASHAHTNSVDQSTIPYNMTSMAQRQSALLGPSSRLPFTKIQWRDLMAQPEIAIARELTRIDWIMFSAIQPRDMVRHITVRNDERCRYRDLSNVTRWVEHFNHVAYWTTNLVLLRDKPKHRALALEKLILIARKLRELNNYNSLGAVVAGIQGAAVHRLCATRDLLPTDVQKNLMKLEVLMSTQRGHSAYRLAWENSSGARIPFLPLHRRDLVVAEQGNKTWITVEGEDGVQDKRINWNKFSIMGSMLWDLYEAQSKPYKNMAANDGIKRLVLDGDIVKDDDKLYDRSQAVELSAHGGGRGRRFAPWLARYGM